MYNMLQTELKSHTLDPRGPYIRALCKSWLMILVNEESTEE